MATSQPVPAEQIHEPGAVRTFLIADVRGYTRFTQEQGDEAAAAFASLFAQLVREGVQAWSGDVIELRGDEALVAFASARQALRAALDLQARFATEAERQSLPLFVGIGLDSGEAVPVEGGYRGGALNLAARLCSLAAPGEVLASEGVTHLARKTDGLEYAERGLVDLKGFADQVRVIEVRPTSLPKDHPSPTSSPDREAVVEQSLPIGGFLGALPSERLVAREEELATILSTIDAVDGGSGRVILLAGEPGVGKTRLAQEATLQVRNRRFLVASGRCYEPRQTVAFYPFLEVLSTLYVCSPESVRMNVRKKWAYLGRLLPDFDIPSPAPSSDGVEEQERLFRAVTSFVQTVAELSPVAILLDDLHWADAASLELVQHLARHTRGHRVLIVGTYRDVEVGRQHPLEAALRDLNRERLVEELPVRRLSREGTRALTAATFGEEEVSAEFAELLQRHTEGNPFFLAEVLRALVERGDIYREKDRWERREIGDIEVPKSVRSALGERLSRLPEEAQEILYEASVLGQTFLFDDLEQMGDRGEKQLEEALEQAVSGGLIRETGKDGYAFNHALTQQALYEELPSRRRRRLHMAAGEALEKQPEKARERRAAELAWHFLEGDDPARAFNYALLAGDQSEAVFAHEEAEKHYRIALELARESSDVGHEAEALRRLAATLAITGRHDQALAMFEAAITGFRALGDLSREGFVIARAGRTHAAAGSGQKAIPLVEDAIKSIEPTDHKEALGELLAVLSTLYFVTGRYEDMNVAAQRAAKVGREAGSSSIVAEAEFRRATALQKLGHLDEGIAVAEAIMPMLEAQGSTDVLVRHLNNTGFAYYLKGNFGKSRLYRERALDQAYTRGDLNGAAFAHTMMCQELLAIGEWNEARGHIDSARQVTASLPASWVTAVLLSWAGRMNFVEGDWSSARSELEESVRLSEGSGDLQALTYAQALTAELDLEEGKTDNAILRLEPLFVRSDAEEKSWMAPPYALAKILLGQHRAAEDMITESESSLRDMGNRWNLVDLLIVLGILRREQGRYDEAEAALTETVSMTRDMPYPYAQGRALLEWATLEIKRGNFSTAREHLDEAHGIFQQLGARPHLEKTQGVLASLP